MNSPLRALGAACLLAVALASTGCTVGTLSPEARSPSAVAPNEMRPLTPAEKAALAQILARTLENPADARFKWLPVATGGSGPIGYCGLVTAENVGGDIPRYRRFFALIAKGATGEYTSGRIEHLEGGAAGAWAATSDSLKETRLTEENCKAWGYSEFSEASP
jgi:hypothetical protein